MAYDQGTIDRRGLLGVALASRPGSHLADIARRRGLAQAAGAIAIVLMILVSAAYALVKPDYNWDMVAYTGAALENRFPDAAGLHAETWRQIDAVVPADQQAVLKTADSYRQAQWQSPENFQSQLGMYRVKTGYIMLLRAVEPIAGLVTGAMLLSILASVAFGLLVLWIMWREKALAAGLALAPALLIAGYARMTSSVAPDMLLAIASTAALYALYRGRDVFGCVLLIAATLIRPDAVIFNFAILIAAVLFGMRWSLAALAFIASFAIATVMSELGGHPGWWAHFWFSTVETQASMAGFHPDFSLAAFAKGYVRGLLSSLHSSSWLPMLALMTFGWALFARIAPMSHRAHALIFAMGIGALGKFASFPLPDDRFYFGFIAGMAILLAISWTPRLTKP
jgi:hypothetical protein